MSTDQRTPDPVPTLGPDAVAYDAYACVPLEDGEIVLYDLERTNGWIQSDEWIGIDDVR